MKFKEFGNNEKEKLNSYYKFPTSQRFRPEKFLSSDLRTNLNPSKNLLNQNRISYGDSESFVSNKLIRPIAKRVRPKLVGSVWSRNQPRLNQEDMFTPEKNSSVGKKDFFGKFLFNSNIQQCWNFHQTEIGQSPKTTHSTRSCLNRSLFREKPSQYFSSLHSPNLVGDFNLKIESNIPSGKYLISKKKAPSLVNNFLIKPQTNNNYNIFNVINDRPMDPRTRENNSSVLQKRNDSMFGSPKNEARKNVRTGANEEVLASLERIAPPNSENDEEETNAGEEQVTLKIKIKSNCGDNCQSEQIKSQILELAKMINLSPQKCVELSFDNSVKSGPFAKIANAKNCSKSLIASPSSISNAKKSTQEKPLNFVQNIVWNSFLRNQQKSSYSEQLTRTIQTVLNKLKNNSQLIYHKVNIFTLINLQVPLDNRKFHSLSASVKLRVVCMLYAKYVNRKLFSQLCSQFLSCVNFNREFLSESVLFK